MISFRKVLNCCSYMEFKIDVNTEMWRREETLSKVKGFNVEYVEE